MTRKTWALRLLIYSFFLSTADTGHATCQHCTSCCTLHNSSSDDCVSCSTDDACCIKLDNNCLLPVCRSTPTYEKDEDENNVSLTACKTSGILGALLAFILGVIVGLLVAWLRRKKRRNPHQESPANTVMSEMVNTRLEHKDQHETSGNHCEDIYSLAQVPTLPSGVSSVLQLETSVLNDQDSDTDEYFNLRVVGEAETREYTPLTPPDKKNSIAAPPVFSQEMMVNQHLTNIDEAGYTRITDTAHVSRPSEHLRHQSATIWQARSTSPLELRSDDANVYNRLDRHDNQTKALSWDDNYHHLQTIRYRLDNPLSGGYELATLATEEKKTKKTEAAQSFNIPERSVDNPKSLSCSPSASDDHQEERLKHGALTGIKRHEYFELEPLQGLRDDDIDVYINNDLNDDIHNYSSPHHPNIRRLLEQQCEENHPQDAHQAEVLGSSDYELLEQQCEENHPQDAHQAEVLVSSDYELLEQQCEENHPQDAHKAEVLVSSDYELAKFISDKDPL